ncbi:MAG: aminodeoxychorismate/anthranilate synthase component II [Planctomycetota bacterium]
MILIIDNYDSFTYNLVQYVGTLRPDVEVVRNDHIDAAGVAAMVPEKIIISPGPGRPETSGCIVEVINVMAGKVPILGVCLGHQAIGHAFGGKVVHAPCLMHGKTSSIRHDGKGVFRGLPNPITATRYHSLVVAREGLPACLEITAEADDHVIMGLRHREMAVEGVQFHPESLMTKDGMTIIRNFIG